MPIVEPEILLDGDHSIERTLEVAERVWSEVFFYLAENNVMFEGILLKPSMVTPGADHKEKASPETIAKFTLTMLKRRVPPAVPGVMVCIDKTLIFWVFMLALVNFLHLSTKNYLLLLILLVTSFTIVSQMNISLIFLFQRIMKKEKMCFLPFQT